ARGGRGVSARGDAIRTFATVAATGTDPQALLAVTCWAMRPGRSIEALRRRCRDEPDLQADGPGAGVAAAAGDPPVDLLAPAAEVAVAWRRLGVRVALVGDATYPARLAEGWPDVDGP